MPCSWAHLLPLRPPPHREDLRSAQRFHNAPPHFACRSGAAAAATVVKSGRGVCTATATPTPSSSVPVVAAADLLASVEALAREKDSSTAVYLNLIEEEVDAFLVASCGFVRDAVPYNYLDDRPASAGAVRANADILAHLLAEVFHPGGGVQQQLIQPLTARIWAEVLAPLEHDMQLMIADVERALHRTAGAKGPDGGGGGGGGGGVDERAALKRAHETLRRDLHYLATIRQQEASWTSEAAEVDDGDSPSNGNSDAAEGGLRQHRLPHRAPARSRAVADVVPISGLIVSRLHRLENEHRTVIDHWRL